MTDRFKNDDVRLDGGETQERAALETHELSKSYEGLRVVDAVSIRLKEGELRAIIGPNGAGKTTLFNLISGALQVDSGRVFVGGEDVTSLRVDRRVRKGISRSFQITNIFAELSVAENVWLCVNSKSEWPWNPWQSIQRDRGTWQKVEEVCEIVGLAAKLKEAAGLLSQADQRLLEIAMALAGSPSVLLLDEPTQGVGTHEVEVLTGVIGRAASYCSVLVIEHNMECVLEIADVVTVMANGKVVAEGTPEHIVSNDEVQRVYLGVEP